MSRIHLYTILLGCLALCACSTEEPVQGGEIEQPAEPEEKIAVSFSSKLYLEPDTKTATEGTTANLSDGANVAIHVFRQAAMGVPDVAALTRRDYKVAADGSLTATADEAIPMYLGAGTYTFYALSVNMAGEGAEALPPELADGNVSSGTVELKNGTDYLYCAVNRKFSSNMENAVTVSLPFERLAARIQLTITSTGDAENVIVAATAPSVTLPLTDPAGSKITLGAIPQLAPGEPVTDMVEYTELVSEGNVTDGFVADCILLPMKAKADVISLSVTILFPSITFSGLGEQTDKVYTLEIPIPKEEGFASGKQYNYKVNITGNEVGFGGLTVVPWTAKTGNLPNDDMTEDQEGNK